jgi:molecular chaperone GrpE
MQSIRRIISYKALNGFASRGYTQVSPFSCGLRRSLFSTGSETPKTGSEAPATTELEACRKELAEKEQKFKELKDSYLLSLADMENLRERTRRDVIAAGQFAIQRFCKDLVSVVDIMEMALGSLRPRNTKEQSDSDALSTPAGTDPAKQLKDLTDGLSMTLEELHKAFNKHGLTVIDPLYQKFDPNEHNAIFQVPATDVEPGTVVNVQKKGYMLNQRVVRPAEVGVSRKP